MESKSLQETILQVLGETTGLKPQQCITLADLFALVQKEIPTPAEEQSLFYVTISKTLGKLRKQGLCVNPRRGFWGLSADGILFCRGGDIPESCSSNWAESDDAYLLSLASQMVPCFGWFRSTSKFCSQCYLAEVCQQQAPSVRQHLLESLLSESVASTPVVSTETEPIVSINETEVEIQVETLLSELLPLSKKAPKLTPKLRAKMKRILAQGHILQVTAERSFCAKCGEAISIPQVAVWEEDTGYTHVSCWVEDSP